MRICDFVCFAHLKINYEKNICNLKLVGVLLIDSSLELLLQLVALKFLLCHKLSGIEISVNERKVLKFFLVDGWYHFGVNGSQNRVLLRKFGIKVAGLLLVFLKQRNKSFKTKSR